MKVPQLRYQLDARWGNIFRCVI